MDADTFQLDPLLSISDPLAFLSGPPVSTGDPSGGSSRARNANSVPTQHHHQHLPLLGPTTSAGGMSASSGSGGPGPSALNNTIPNHLGGSTGHGIQFDYSDWIHTNPNPVPVFDGSISGFQHQHQHQQQSQQHQLQQPHQGTRHSLHVDHSAGMGNAANNALQSQSGTGAGLYPHMKTDGQSGNGNAHQPHSGLSSIDLQKIVALGSSDMAYLFGGVTSAPTAAMGPPPVVAPVSSSASGGMAGVSVSPHTTKSNSSTSPRNKTNGPKGAEHAHSIEFPPGRQSRQISAGDIHHSEGSSNSTSQSRAPRSSHSQGNNDLLPISRRRASPSRSNRTTVSGKTHNTSGHQPDESVPEAALHLLRLALPSNSNGSVGGANSSRLGGEDASCDEDAEGESDVNHTNNETANGRGGGSDGRHENDSRDLHQHQFAAQRRGERRSGRQSIPSSAKPGDIAVVDPAAEAALGSFSMNYGTSGARRTSGNSATSTDSQQQVRMSRQYQPVRTQRERANSNRAGSEASTASVDGEGRSVVKNTTPGTSRRVSDNVEGDSDNYSDRGEGSGNSSRALGEGETGLHDDSFQSETGTSKGARGKESSKRSFGGSNNPRPGKKARTSSVSGSANGGTPAPRRPRRIYPLPINTPSRIFPPEVQQLDQFARFYRAFPVSSAFPPDSYVHRLRPVHHNSLLEGADAYPSGEIRGEPERGDPKATTAAENIFSGFSDDSMNGRSYLEGQDLYDSNGTLIAGGIGTDSPVVFMQPPEGSKWNKSSDPLNLYTPKFVRGNADEKTGVCPICIESVERGGEGEEKWLKLKNSSYVYHMSYAHGLSNVTGKPFSPPVQIRNVPTEAETKDSRAEMLEGLCHKCETWIPLLSIKNVDAVVPELIWWKHAKPCHGDTQIPNEGEPFIDDAVYRLVMSRKASARLMTGNVMVNPME